MPLTLDSTPRCVLDLHATLGEGPVWSEREQALYFVDIREHKIHRFDPESGAHHSWPTPSEACFLLPVDDGTFLCGLRDGLHRFDPETGALSQHKAIEPERPDNRLNDGCVDLEGRLWFGTMDDNEAAPNGSIYCVRHKDYALDVTHHGEGYTVSNGPAISPDGRTLYVCDSPEQEIYAFDLSEDGALSNRRVFAKLDHGYPDGVVTDSEGTVWCGTWGGGRISRFRADGSELPSIPMPCTNVTKVAFGGADHRTVFVTTARKGLEPDVLAREPHAGSLFALRADVPGNRQATFRLSPG